MRYFASVQQNYQHFFLRFQAKDQILMVNKSKIAGENTFNGDHFWIEGNPASSKDTKKLFVVFFQISHQSFNP